MNKCIITLITSLFLNCLGAQTNVSGGIYSNTTWSLSGSPYVVTSTVVVFPGNTLTIEPGVVVKFDAGMQIEIRQAALIAQGLPNDSITFSSNAGLSAGAWNNIYLNGGSMGAKFNYCKFNYATNGIFVGGTTDSLTLKNSTFMHNTVGLDGSGIYKGVIDSCYFANNASCGANNVSNTILNYCNFAYNASGIVGILSTINNTYIHHNTTGLNGFKGNTIINSRIEYNGTGISCQRGCAISYCTVKHNQSGITTGNTIHDDNAQISHTLVDSNANVGIQLSNRLDNVSYCTITNNGTGITDSNGDNLFTNTITNNNVSNNGLGMQISFTYDQISCNRICNNSTYDLKYTGTSNFSLPHNYWCTADSAATESVIYDGYDNISYGLVNFMPIDSACSTTGINEYKSSTLFNLWPNPTEGTFTIETSTPMDEIQICDVLGNLIYENKKVKESRFKLSLEKRGVYFITIKLGAVILTRRLLIAD
jgi:hypothetical protein